MVGHCKDPKQRYNYGMFERSRLNSVQEKAAMLKFLSNQETCQLSPLKEYESQRQRHTNILVDIVNNHSNVQLNRTITYNFQ